MPGSTNAHRVRDSAREEPMIPRPTNTTPDALSDALNAVDHEARVAWLRSLSGKEEAALYALAAGSTLTVEEMHRGADDVVIHEGWNSLPFFRSFQKRVTVHDGQLQGYNHQTMRPVTGPGHFRVRESEDVHGEVWFDYEWEPTTVPEPFPAARSNTAGLSILVYGNMIDVVRKVSDHVTIGRAYIKRKETGNYFGLVRTNA
jgi:hypothetical protein